MKREEILAALKCELDSFTDEDLEVLTKGGYHSPHIWFKFGASSMSNANTALHNVNASRSRAQFERWKSATTAVSAVSTPPIDHTKSSPIDHTKSQACRFGLHGNCSRENTLGTSACTCACHASKT